MRKLFLFAVLLILISVYVQAENLVVEKNAIGNNVEIAKQTNFVMDGVLDPEAVLLSENGNLKLYASFDGVNLYVAGNSAVSLGRDVFIIVAKSPGSLRSAMWAKSGQVANWDAFLGAESTNGWSGWFDVAGTSAQSQTGSIVEGTLNVFDEWGTIPDSIFISLATFNTSDGGTLAGQAPAGNGNGNIESNEFISFNLIASLSAILFSPEIDNSFGDPLRAPYFIKSGDSVNVSGTYVTNIEPLDSLFLYFNDDLIDQTDQDTISKIFNANLFSSGLHQIMLVAKGALGTLDTAFSYIMLNPTVPELQRPVGTVDGINYNNSTSVTLSLFAPYKEFVYLIGDFNDWKIDTLYYMKRDSINADSVHWWFTLTGLTPAHEYAYQYLVDSNIRIADPYTEKVLDPWNDQQIISLGIYPGLKPYPAGKTDEPVSVFQTDKTPFIWVYSDTFSRPVQKDLVIYEMLVRDFISNHNYATLRDTLIYFKKLGINAIELMPVNEFEGNSSWGYNPSFYFAPDKYYGPADDLKMFIDECHRHGIAVIMDIVLNHSYGQSPLVRLYWDAMNNRPATNNPWFNVQSPNPVYSWGYDFNHAREATKKFVDRVNKYWLTEYRFDGFRFDFTKGFTNTPGDGGGFDQSRINILKRMADKIWEVDSTAYIILEHFADNNEEKILAEYDRGMMLWGNSNYNYNEATMGYHSGGQSDFSWGFYKTRGWNKPGLVTYMESHDEERLMYKNITYGNSSGNYNIQDTVTAINRIKMAAAFFFAQPGPKMMWQFQELGYDYSIDYNGRIGEKPIRWDYYNNDEARKKLYKTFAALIKLRNENEAFRAENATLELNLNSALKRIRVTHSSMNASIIGNFGVTSGSIAANFVHPGFWYDFFTGEQLTVTSTNDPILLEPGEFHIYTDKKVFTPEPDILNDIEDQPQILPDKISLKQNYPNPFNPVTSIKYELPMPAKVSLKIFDITGKQIIELQNDNKSAGVHSINWNGINSGGKIVSSGVYIYQLLATSVNGETYKQQRKMLLIK